MEKGNIGAKLEVLRMTRSMMPNGVPDFDVISAKIPIKILSRTIDPSILQTALTALIVDFCDSLNVKQTMNKTQCIEAAFMLYDKADMYRLEDYAVMFTMAKRGELIGTTYNKIDITDIAEIMSCYDAKRQIWLEKTQDVEYKNFESKLNNTSGMGDFTIGDALEVSMKAWDKEKPLNTFPKQQDKLKEALEKYKSQTQNH